MYSIESLHYKFRVRKNVVDSNQRFNFTVEQIDEYLQEGLEIYISLVSSELEYSQKRIDDLRPIVKMDEQLSVVDVGSDKTVFNLPKDYYRRMRCFSKPQECPKAVITNIPVQLDDLGNYLLSEDYKPSLYWREGLMYIHGNFLTVYHGGEFTPNATYLDYLIKHPRLGNPEKSRAGAYLLADGTPAVQQGLLLDTTNQPDIIVEIALLNATMDTGSQEYQLRLNKLLNLNRI